MIISRGFYLLLFTWYPLRKSRSDLDCCGFDLVFTGLRLREEICIAMIASGVGYLMEISGIARLNKEHCIKWSFAELRDNQGMGRLHRGIIASMCSDLILHLTHISLVVCVI